MPSNIRSSGNCGSPYLGSHCHVPVTSSTTLYAAGMNCGDALSLPSQNRTWLLDNFSETCGQPSSYQPSSCVPRDYKISCYPSTTYCTFRSCRGTGFFPISSYLSSSCQPSMHNRPQNCLSRHSRPQNHLSYGYQPQNFISCGYRPLNFVSGTCNPVRYLSYGCQPFSYASSSFRPLDYVSNRFQPVRYIQNSFQPACSSFGTWQSPFIRRSC
ncbi:keratin-associated protein 26-1 [Neofelis nebulosa]|uniref:keratin-associated protein 26-1 n=1 Tax=Neofelis nebulosa TaxID=61452 RepID=UPI0027298B3D|nr:keratin-associated protein 26-1 [Neofelis nebulosa]